MEQKFTNVENQIVDPAGSFETKVGRTTYVVGVYFNEKSKASYDDKAKKWIFHAFVMLVLEY